MHCRHHSHSPQRFLLIDDDVLILKAMTRALGKVPSLEVRTASSYDEALAIASTWRPDLVLSDIDLGSGSHSGFDIALALRGSATVALMSGVVDEDRLALATEVGAVALLQKPFQVAATVLHLLGR